MKYTETKMSGLYIIKMTPVKDDRGSFARVWCKRDFLAHGMDVSITQSDISYNRERGTLRGMHFQRGPRAEGKLVRCTHGAIFDAVLDIRPSSPTYLQHFTITLTCSNDMMLYIPPGCAHGFQTLDEDAVVSYLMTEYYDASLAGGIRWDDPVCNIQWPFPDDPIMSERDKSFPDFSP